MKKYIIELWNTDNKKEIKLILSQLSFDDLRQELADSFSPSNYNKEMGKFSLLDEWTYCKSFSLMIIETYINSLDNFEI